jgi:endogenous inhibitor of DNA gyrase (YacG/DUF329 family)
MPSVVINCPSTGKPVPTGIGADAGSFATMQLSNNTLSGCPECGGNHTWSKEDAFLAAE